MFLHISFLTGIAIQLRIHILQFLGGNKGHLRRKLHPQLRIAHMESVIGAADCLYNGTNNQLQIVQIPVFPGDDFFPVPLVHIDRVNVIQILITADCVHVRVQAVAHTEIIAFQRQTLPFCQRMDNLCVLPHRRHIKADRPLKAVQVIVQAGILRDKQWRGHTLQIQSGSKLFLKSTLDVRNRALGIVFIQNGLIPLGNINGVHITRPPFEPNGKLCYTLPFLFPKINCLSTPNKCLYRGNIYAHPLAISPSSWYNVRGYSTWRS